MKYSTRVALMIGLAICATPAWAGEWVSAYGSTLEGSMEMAMKAAQAKIATKNKGCIAKNSDTGEYFQILDVIEIKGKEVWKAAVWTNNQNGSCGLPSWDQQALRKMGGDIVSSLVAGGKMAMPKSLASSPTSAHMQSEGINNE